MSLRVPAAQLRIAPAPAARAARPASPAAVAQPARAADQPTPRTEGWLLYGTPALTGAGAVIGTLLRGRAGGAIGAVVGGVLGSAISAVPLLLNWKHLPGDQQQQIMGSAIAAGSVLGGAGVGFLVGGPIGAMAGAAIGSVGLLATHLIAGRQPRTL